ncbi:hypothetical protein NFI96_013689 [Prochilodus magdalenae]|nr:hypothetical protein NFI96_013689 [Prochilodus magdalenae]
MSSNGPCCLQFLGNTEVEQPKGTEVVKDAVRKLKFQRHIKKSEGQKIPKVELQISIYGVKILDPKTKAEEITLTIGQAFDLAYKKFLESGGKDVETRKQIGTLQKRVRFPGNHSKAVSPCCSQPRQLHRHVIQELETENSELKKQLQALEEQLLIAQVPPLLHINSTNKDYMLQRPSSLFWCHNLTSFSCLEISSVTLTPMSSPDSNFSAGVLTPPPAKPALPKPLTEAGIPRPQGGGNSKVPTDIFDMVPFSPVAPLVPLPASNASPPPPPARPGDNIPPNVYHGPNVSPQEKTCSVQSPLTLFHLAGAA